MNIGTMIEGIEMADVLFGVLTGSYALSEVLPHVKKVKANSVFQLCSGAVKAIFRRKQDDKKQYLQ